MKNQQNEFPNLPERISGLGHLAENQVAGSSGLEGKCA
jgi:hypothetical protein